MWTYWGIGKKTAFKASTEATPAELTELSQLSVEEMPSADVVFWLWEVFCAGSLAQKSPTGQYSWEIEVEALSEPTWGIDKIPPHSAGARYQHNYTLGVHAAAYVWSQDLVENPNIPDHSR